MEGKITEQVVALTAPKQKLIICPAYNPDLFTYAITGEQLMEILEDSRNKSPRWHDDVHTMD